MAEARVVRRLAAILAADVAGYSRLMGADEVGTLAALKSHRREIVDPAINAHHGRIVKTTGDGMLVEFASVVDAVTCAMAVQEKMAELSAETGVPPIQFRIGINIGDIIMDTDDIFGDGVNIAVRVENECEPGGVYVSGGAFEQVRGKTKFMFHDLGDRSLKNIDRPVRIYAVRSVVSPATTNSAAEVTKLLPLPDKPSIAVLPFNNMSGDPEQEYFADGVVEDIITALSRFKSLFVIARNSSFFYKDKAANIKQIGRELGVRYVLEGSVRKSGSRLRIAGQLIEAATGAHIWAEKIDGQLEDVFDLQDQVTRSVVGAILPSLMQAEIALANRKPPSTWSCYDRYLRGNALLFQFSPATLDEAKEEYQQALSLDSDFAPAVATLSTCYVVQRFLYGQDLGESRLAKALELSRRAAELAPDDGMVLSLCALTVTFLSDDLEKAMILAERAVSLNPNISMAWAVLGWIHNWQGEPERACEAFDRSARLNPLDRLMLVTHILPGTSLACFLLGRQDQWLMCVNRLLALDPNNLSGLLDALDIARQQGRNGDAEKLLQRIETLHPGLRSSQVRDIFRRVRKPEHQALFDQWLIRLALPE
ncbi:adenylate/guanylate cyclase domain-containing protein [Bradyrhizobium sp. UFLA05-153]